MGDSVNLPDRQGALLTIDNGASVALVLVGTAVVSLPEVHEPFGVVPGTASASVNAQRLEKINTALFFRFIGRWGVINRSNSGYC